MTQVDNETTNDQEQRRKDGGYVSPVDGYVYPPEMPAEDIQEYESRVLLGEPEE